MTMIKPNMCLACQHLEDRGLYEFTPGPPKCKAFPGGIPERYWTGGASHTDPDGEDNGIVFKLHPVHAATLEAYYRTWFEPDPGEDPVESGGSKLDIDSGGGS